MTYRGKYSRGAVVLPPGVDIPEGAEVEVTALPPHPNGGEPEHGPTLYETLQEFVGVLDDLPSDFARNHEHYIHGTPKK